MSSIPRVGTELAGYRLESLIGRGGMSVVYLAEHTRIGKKVALKILAPELTDDERFRERFVREWKIAAALDHPNIIPIYDAGESDGLLFIAMRYVDGTDVRTLLQRGGALEPPHALSIIGQVGSALDVAHGRGLIHRDVKPGNILIDPAVDTNEMNHVYLADFGLVKRTLSTSGITRTGQFVGTLDYVSPEQVQGRPVDHRADIYSLGCVFFECLTGEIPFARDDDVAKMWAHVREDVPSVSAREPSIPSALDAVVGKAMAKDPDERYASCREFAKAASQALGVGVLTVTPAPEADEDRTIVAPKRPSTAATAGATAAAEPHVGLAAGIPPGRSSQPPAPPPAPPMPARPPLQPTSPGGSLTFGSGPATRTGRGPGRGWIIGVVAAIAVAAAVALFFLTRVEDESAGLVTIDAGPSGTVSDTTAVFTFSAEDAAGFECALDDSSYRSCTSPRSYTDLEPGSHTFRVRATSPRGDAGPVQTREWTIETIGPTGTTGATGPTGETGAFPSADELALLEHVPASTRSSCQRGNLTLTPRMVAAVDCTSQIPRSGETVAVRYIQFDDVIAMRTVYNQERRRRDVAVGQNADGGCEQFFFSESPYSIGGQQRSRGRVLCYPTARQTVSWQWWTDEKLEILSIARLDSDAGDELHRWWTSSRSGPID